MPTSVDQAQVLQQRPISRFGLLDDAPRKIAVLESLDSSGLRKLIGGRFASARVLRQLKAGNAPLTAVGQPDVPPELRERLLRNLVHPADARLAITDVQPVGGPVMGGQPFDLRVEFAAPTASPPRLVSICVDWDGEQFVNELRIDTAPDAGYVDVHFDKKQTLPYGPATFTVSLYNALGSCSTFTTTSAVLPSNPFQLRLGPNNAFVTGTWSARGVRNGSAFDTGVAVTLLNGSTTAVAMRPGFHWAFWNGGVGGSLVEQGDGSFGGGNFSVSASGSWGGSISFHSPSGSGIFDMYNNRQDMTIQLTMARADGTTVSSTITARTMFSFGVNVTRVANEDYTAQEAVDLLAAAQRTRTIYERTDMTFDIDTRFIARANVGGFEVIDSFDEFHDLLDDWSGPDTNNNIDAFIVQAIDVGGGVDGIDGSIPGPTSHGGSNSGVIASKTGFVDASGVRRLHSNYLGMLIGHELGHYLGLEHVNTPGDLMLPSSGENDINLSYDQYRTMIRHGWVRID